MREYSLIRSVEVGIEHIRFKVHCFCGKVFIAEDFEPECPYCDKIYSIEMLGNKKEVKISIFE